VRRVWCLSFAARAVLQHDSLFSYVLAREGRIRDTKWFASFKTVKDGKEVPIPRPEEDLQKNLHVNAIADSQLVRVTFEALIRTTAR